MTDVDGDEVSLVKRGANRRRHLLLKEDAVELEDMASVPVEYEGALTDLLRKEGTDEAAIEAAVTGLRLLKAAGEELPDEIREVVEKLGSQMYPIVNRPLNNMDGADNENEGVNGDADDTRKDDDEDVSMAAPDAGDDDGPDEDEMDRLCKAEDGDGEGPDDNDDVAKADLSTAGRRRMASGGTALPDGSFPIPNVAYLKRAIRAFGRAGDKPRAKAWITRRARALGRTDLLPSKWGAGGGNVNKEGTVSEGTAATAVPVPIRKDDGTWDLSGVPEESRPFFETVLKAQDEIAAERDALRSEVAEAREDVKKERDQRVEREFVAKAEGFSHVFENAAEIGPILKEIADAIPEESFEMLEKALAGAEERIAKGDLFKEMGRSGGSVNGDSGGDAWAQIEKLADEMVEKSEDLSKEQAVDRVLKTAAGRELYGRYLVETAGGV